MQATASIDPQIDILGWLPYVRGAIQSQPVTLGGRPDSGNGATVFLVDFHAITTDILIGLTGGLSAAVPHDVIANVTVAPQSTILGWYSLGRARLPHRCLARGQQKCEAGCY
jgi:hypothetical protein